MTMSLRGNPLLTVALTVGLLVPAVAEASTINIGTAGCVGSSCTLSYAGGILTLASVNGTFQAKSEHGETGLGVSGRTAGEIDVNEAITGSFSSPVMLDAFRILFLYNGPEFGDPNEVGQITVNGTTAGTLTVNGENTALWSLPGASVSNCGDTTAMGTGCFLVSQPFGKTSISTISFTALHSAAGTPPVTNDSDYSLSRVDVTPVPEPASLTLIGMALVGVRMRRARRL